MQSARIIKLKPLFHVIAGLLLSAGVFLYLASYFTGLWLISAGILLLLVYRGLAAGSRALREEGKKWFSRMVVPVAGTVSAVLIGAVVMLFAGYNPLQAYAALFYGGFVKNWYVSVLNAVPLIFTGLSIAFAFQAGLFNIGAEGQYYVGSMAALFLGIYCGFSPLLAIPLIFLVSGLSAALYNAVPALLKVKTGAHEVITTMMFAHIARYFTSIFIRAFGGHPATSAHAYVTDPILPSNWLPVFKDILPAANYRLHIGIIIAVLTALLVYYLLYHTRWGFELRATGQNRFTAEAQGIPVKKVIFFALLFAGFLAGLSGTVQVLGLNHKLFENLDAGYGWNGISVSLLAMNHPVGVIFTSLLWGSLDAGGQYMSRTLQIPNSIVEIIKGIILFLVVARYLYARAGDILKKIRAVFRKEKKGAGYE